MLSNKQDNVKNKMVKRMRVCVTSYIALKLILAASLDSRIVKTRVLFIGGRYQVQIKSCQIEYIDAITQQIAVVLLLDVNIIENVRCNLHINQSLTGSRSVSDRLRGNHNQPFNSHRSGRLINNWHIRYLCDFGPLFTVNNN